MGNINVGKYSLNNFITRIRNSAMQNLGTDQFDNDDWIIKINRGISYMYDYINSRHNWYYSTVREEIVKDESNPKVFTAQFMLNKLHFVYVDGKELERKYLFFQDTNDDVFYVDNNGRIVTNKDYDKILVIYQKKPYPLTINDMSVYIDIPGDLVGLLEEMVLWRVFPFNLHEGAQLANNFFAQFTEQMNEYISNVGYLQLDEQFITESKN